jgi:hypothetical protein
MSEYLGIEPDERTRPRGFSLTDIQMRERGYSLTNLEPDTRPSGDGEMTERRQV